MFDFRRNLFVHFSRTFRSENGPQWAPMGPMGPGRRAPGRRAQALVALGALGALAGPWGPCGPLFPTTKKKWISQLSHHCRQVFTSLSERIHRCWHMLYFSRFYKIFGSGGPFLACTNGAGHFWPGKNGAGH